MLKDIALAIQNTKDRAGGIIRKVDELAVDLAKMRGGLRDFEVLADRFDNQAEPTEDSLQDAVADEVAALRSAMAAALAELDKIRAKAAVIRKV
jgi:hypothetical protein